MVKDVEDVDGMVTGENEELGTLIALSPLFTVTPLGGCEGVVGVGSLGNSD